MRIRRVGKFPLGNHAPLISESEAEGFAFLARLRDEWLSGENRFKRTGEALFIVEVEKKIVGLCGLNIDPFTENPMIGRVRRLYVSKAHRRQGIARALVNEAIEAASTHFSTLHLRTDNPAACLFYESLGFIPVKESLCTHRMTLENHG